MQISKIFNIQVTTLLIYFQKFKVKYLLHWEADFFFLNYKS